VLSLFALAVCSCALDVYSCALACRRALSLCRRALDLCRRALDLFLAFFLDLRVSLLSLCSYYFSLCALLICDALALTAIGRPDLDHTADIQIHSWGRSLEESFEQACVGMFG